MVGRRRSFALFARDRSRPTILALSPTVFTERYKQGKRRLFISVNAYFPVNPHAWSIINRRSKAEVDQPNDHGGFKLSVLIFIFCKKEEFILSQFSPFREQITTVQELRDWMGYPRELVVNKAIGHLDAHCRDFIGRSPFLVLATAGATGACDVSPRGDAAGFVHIMDDHHLVIPERPGNRLLYSLRNILSNPRVGLIFLIPGMEETLRVNGRACITRDPELLRQMEAKGKTPKVGIGVEVEECFIHCAKSLKRSRLWQPDTWPDPSDLPSAAQILADHVNLPGVTPEKVEEGLQESYTKRLY